MSNQRKTSLREGSQQANKQAVVGGYKLSHGVRTLLIVVLGWCSLTNFFVGTGWWKLFAIFPNFLFLLKTLNILAPLVCIVFIMILYDME